MNSFSAVEVPLEGKNLIEASAGTGKTYSIALIFLRLILEGKPVDSILAVTFTVSATAELKRRFLQFLRSAKKNLEKNELHEKEEEKVPKEIVSILEKMDNKEELLKRIKRAIADFDKCSVFTIHGFCSKIIKENAFETGARFDLELSADSIALEEAAIDFLRKKNNLLKKEFIERAAKKKWSSIEGFTNLIKKFSLVDNLAILPLPGKNGFSSIENGEYSEEDFCSDASYLVSALLKETREHINSKIEATGEMGFDDLLSILKSALKEENKFSKHLIKTVNKKYHAVLIDEFQDTDLVQHYIFTKLFENSNKPVFYIGDPKQSIYSFRNADVFAYLKVSSGEITKHTMGTNFRSSHLVTQAVNTLFKSVDNPFIVEEIGFSEVKPKSSKHRNLLQKNGVDCHGVEIRYLSSSNGKYAEDLIRDRVKKPNSKRIFFEDLCSRVAELTNSENGFTIDGNSVKPSDITILVLTNKEASEIKSYLEKRGVPAVLSSEESVFKSKEAFDLLAAMEAAATLSSSKIRGALLTMFFQCQPNDIIDIMDSSAFESYLELFSKIGELWAENSFLAAFSQFINNKERYSLLAGSGERTLTNLRHLFELIHQKEKKSGKGVESLIAWMKEKITSSKKSGDEELRLESDENAVTIMTVHKSKGLDFNIVFIPYFMRAPSKQNRNDYFFYHDKEKNYTPVLSLNVEDNVAKAQSVKEELSENMRLLYVALTRAKYLTVLHWGNINGVALDPPTRLLFGVTSNDDFKNSRDSTFLNALENIKERSNGAIEVVEELQDGDLKYVKPPSDSKIKKSREFKGEIGVDWAVTSFSAINYSKDQGNISKLIGVSDELPEETIEVEILAKDGISLFPAGATAGTVLHTIFENIDFKSLENRDVIAEILEENFMRTHSSGKDMVPWVEECVENVLSAPFLNGFSLKNSDCQYTSEFEFFLPSKKFDYSEIGAILGDSVNMKVGSAAGFLHGFIDLVVRNNGKYYIIDWKSNKLGDHFSHYSQKALKNEMVKHNYILQYMLYLVAFDTYISKRDPNYSYKNNFGGVRYVFLRGVTSENNYATGIYEDFPKEETLRKLQSLFNFS